MRKFILAAFMISIYMSSFAQQTMEVSSINKSLSYITAYTKNLEDSGFEILHLNLSNYPFKLGSIKIDDFSATSLGEHKIYIKGIAIFQKDNLDFGKLAIEGKDKNDLNNEKDKEVIQEKKYAKTIDKDGAVTYTWNMEYIPTWKMDYFHEIYFYAYYTSEIDVRPVMGTKDMGIVPKIEQSKIKIIKKNSDQLILIVYRKAPILFK